MATASNTKARSATAQKAAVVSDIYEVEESDADLPENRFKFRGPDKTTIYDVPKLGFLKPSLVREVDENDPVTSMLAVLDEYCPGLGVQFKDGNQLGKLFLAWAAASGVDLGE